MCYKKARKSAKFSWNKIDHCSWSTTATVKKPDPVASHIYSQRAHEEHNKQDRPPRRRRLSHPTARHADRSPLATAPAMDMPAPPPPPHFGGPAAGGGMPDRKTVERNRRNQMNALYSRLDQLVRAGSSPSSAPPVRAHSSSHIYHPCIFNYAPFI